MTHAVSDDGLDGDTSSVRLTMVVGARRVSASTVVQRVGCGPVTAR